MVLTLKQQQPAVFSSRAATLGAHATLDAPTGANMLGWAASKCYSVIEEPLLAGRLRFSNAVRLVGGEAAFRNPATLLEPKHESCEPVVGFAAFRRSYPDKQAQAVKGHLVTNKGLPAPRPRFHHRLRTAMVDGAADSGRLFGYQSVEPGDTELRATIEADGVSDAVWDALLAAFHEQALYIGRGATSGYGGAYKCTVEGDDPWPEPGGHFRSDRVRLWLLSDAMFVDQWGAPRLVPSPTDLGLKASGWEVDPSESSVTSRRIWPWNGTYSSRDVEMAVVEAGSVISFRRTAGAADEELVSRFGAGQERGFGRYVVLADGIKFGTNTTVPLDSRQRSELVEVDSSLIRLAMERKARNQGYANSAWADQRIIEVSARLERLDGEGPGPSQWSRLERLVPVFLSGDAGFEKACDKLLSNSSWQAGLGELGDWVRTSLFATNVSPSPNEADFQRVISRARVKAQGAG